MVGAYNVEEREWDLLTFKQVLAVAWLVNSLVILLDLSTKDVCSHEFLRRKAKRECAVERKAIDSYLRTSNESGK